MRDLREVAKAAGRFLGGTRDRLRSPAYDYSAITNEGGFRDKLRGVEIFCVSPRQEWPVPIGSIADTTFADAVVLDMRDLDRLAKEVHRLAIIDTVPASVAEGKTTVTYPAFTPDGVRAFGALAIIYKMMLNVGEDPFAGKSGINIDLLTSTTRSWLNHHPLARVIQASNYQKEPVIPWDGIREEGVTTGEAPEITVFDAAAVTEPPAEPAPAATQVGQLDAEALRTPIAALKEPAEPVQIAAEQAKPEFGFTGPFWETKLGQAVRTFADDLAETMPHHLYANKSLDLLQLEPGWTGIVGYLVGKGILTGRHSSDWKFYVELPHVLTIGLILLHWERGYTLAETSQRLGELLDGTSLRRFIGSINPDYRQSKHYPDNVFRPSSPWLSFPLESVKKEPVGPESADLTIVPALTASLKTQRQGISAGDRALADFLAHQGESELLVETGQGGTSTEILPDGKKIEEILSGLSWSAQEAVDFEGFKLSRAEIVALLLLSAPRHKDEVMAGYDISVTHAQLRNALERYLQDQEGRQKRRFW